MRDITVLLTAVGAPGAPSTIRSLRANGERRIRIVGTDAQASAIGLHLSDAGIVVPHGEDPGYVQALEKVCREHHPDVLLPLSTAELLPIARHPKVWKQAGVVPLISDAEALEWVLDKGRLMQKTRAAGIPTPSFRRVRDLEGFRDAISEFGYPHVPVCFKPPRSRGSRGFRLLDPSMDRFRLFMEEKPSNTVTTYEEACEILRSARPFPELLVMEVLPGTEYSVDLLARRGEAILTVPRSRDRVREGIAVAGTILDPSSLPGEIARQVCRLTGLDYNINIQLKDSQEGSPAILEVNPRVAGTLVMAHGAGVNMPYLAIKLALGETFDPPSPKPGTRMIRHWDELFLSPEGQAFRIGER